MGYNQLAKLTANVKALRIALNWRQGEVLDDEQIDYLKQYSGFGGIKSVLFPKGQIEAWEKLGASKEDLAMYHPIMGLHELLESELSREEYKKAFSSIKESVLTAFFTPKIIPETVYSVLSQMGLNPKKLYEPSAGAGIFLTEAVNAFPDLHQIVAVEKDLLTGKVLSALSSSFPLPTKVHINGFEETSNLENDQFDLVVSNIPFGNFAVYDSAYPDKKISGKIHNYFIAKGLDKLADGGLLIYITTSGFLNSPSNEAVRDYLFERANFVSLTIMPDNLMKDSGGTEASSHLLIVQKDSHKSSIKKDEWLLIETEERQNEFGTYSLNKYISGLESQISIGNLIKEGRNQYGNATREYWQEGVLEDIATNLREQLKIDLDEYLNKKAFQAIRFPDMIQASSKLLTLLDAPDYKNQLGDVQLGLFDIGPARESNRALDYLTELDAVYIQKSSARIISIIKISTQPDHEGIVLLCGKTKGSEKYQYKLYSNFEEIKTYKKWMSGKELHRNLSQLSDQIRQYDHEYFFEGDRSLESSFNLVQKQNDVFKDLKPFYRNGMLVIAQNRVGTINQLNSGTGSGTFIPLKNQRENDFYVSYTRMRDSYLELFEAEFNGAGVQSALRKELNSAYDQLTIAYGKLNNTQNRKRIANDTAFGTIILASLERKEGEDYVKSDIMAEPLQQEMGRLMTDDPVTALARCLNELGQVDLPFLCAITELTEEEITHRLDGHIYLNPQLDKWETSSQFLSGNVVLKLAAAAQKTLEQPHRIEYQKSYAAIQSVQPEIIPFDLLDFNLGERWIPVDYYSRFASHFFETEVDVHYFPSADVFKVVVGSYNTKIVNEYAVTPKNGRTMYGNSMLENALENTTPYFTYEISSGSETRRVADNEATQLGHQKIELIRSGFIEWLNVLPEKEKKFLEQLYNDTFNCYVLQQYDGSHLTFPGLDKKNLDISDLYSSQKDAAWRIIQNKGALIDHEVGLGKTLTMIVAAMEMKRLGVIQKPMILALKANVQEIAHTFHLAYPAARILAPGKDDFTPAQRTRILHEIKNNNWDCIILTHDQFGRIPQSNEIQQRIYQIELEHTESDLETVNELGGDISRKMLKGLQVRIKNLDAKLKNVNDAIEKKKDNGVTFEETGVDHLFIDESHKFKNLTFTTRHSRVAGLGNQEGSQKALNMLFAIRTLQEKFDEDLCVTFLSGTPISNSLTELYLIFKYLRPKEMKRQGIENFDGWAAVFAKKTTDFEFSVTNEIIAKERFRHFIKVPELAMFYNEITDYKTARHIGLDKPEIDEVLMNIPPTTDQADFTARLMEFAKTGKGELIGREPLSPREDKGRMLIATNYAKKMATDMRLINEYLYDDHPGNKVNTCARKIAEYYWESTPYKGTQAVFCDIGTPKTDRFNVYDALREKLVRDFKIPASEIAFIHDWRDKKKPEFIRRMNEGLIRVSLGSTEMLGTGNNIQDRMVAMHELDIPWKPSELEQRTGRGARKGNWVAKNHYGNKIKHFIYATEQSLDNYKFNLLKNKQTFISQMKNCELNVRTIDEGSVDEKTGMNFSEYIAVLSGDTTLLQKSKLEKKLAVMESLKVAHYRESRKNLYQLEAIEEKLESHKATLESLKEDQQVYQKHLRPEKDGSKLNAIRLNGLDSVDPEEIGKYLLQLYKAWGVDDPNRSERNHQIGTLYGFGLFIKRALSDYDGYGMANFGLHNSFYAQREPNGIKYTYNGGLPNLDNAKLAARYFINAIDRVTLLVEKYQKEQLDYEKEIPELRQISNKPFANEAEIQSLKSDLRTIEQEIAKKIQDKQIQLAETISETKPEVVPVTPASEDISLRKARRIAI